MDIKKHVVVYNGQVRLPLLANAIGCFVSRLELQQNAIERITIEVKNEMYLIVNGTFQTTFCFKRQ